MHATRRSPVRWIVRLSLLLVLPGTVPASAAEPSTRPAGWRIALVSDPHLSERPKDEAYGRHFRRVLDEVNAAGVDAVLIGGDLTQDGSVAQMGRFAEAVKALHAPVIRYVPGNHDVGQKASVGKTSLGPGRLKSYEDHFGPLYFSAELAPGLRVVGITSSLFGSGLPQEQAQWEFLEKELPTAGAESARTVTLLLSHYPPIAKSTGEPDEYFNIDREPRGRLLKLLDAAGVRTMLAGHLHRPVDYTIGSLHVIGAPAVSFGLPARLQREGWALVTVDRTSGRCVAELHYLPRDPATSGPTTAPPSGK